MYVMRLILFFTFMLPILAIGMDDLLFVKNNIDGLCKNIDGLDFRKVARPVREKEIDHIDYSNIQPRIISKCIDELIEKEIIFEHEFNNQSKISVDLDRKERKGDLNSYSFNVQNVRKILTNRFGDQLTLFDFNRIQSVNYNYQGEANMRYFANCEGWISYSYQGHTYNSFIRHLENYIFIPSLRHSFVNTNSDFVKNATEITDEYFLVGELGPNYYGNNLKQSLDTTSNYGRVYDQSHFCRYYYDDLVDFAFGRYVQLSDMKKIKQDNLNIQKLDTIHIGVGENANFGAKDFYLSDEIREFTGYPRILISDRHDFITPNGVPFLSSIGLTEDDFFYGTNFLDLVKFQLSKIQQLVDKIKTNSCSGGVFDGFVKELEKILGDGKLSFFLKNDNCYQAKYSTPEINFSIAEIFKSTEVSSYNLLSPGYLFTIDDSIYNYVQTIWVGATRITEIDKNIPTKFKQFYSSEVCPQICVGDLPCIKYSIDKKFAVCVGNEIDLVAGCEEFNEKNDTYRCLALKNITRSTDLNELNYLKYFDSFEFRHVITEEKRFINDDYTLYQKEHLINNSTHFFNELMKTSNGRERNELETIDLIDHQSDLNKFTFDKNVVSSQNNCSSQFNFNINGEYFYYPIYADEGGFIWTELENDSTAKDKITCIKKENSTFKNVVVGEANCTDGKITLNDNACVKHLEREFDCLDLNPKFHEIVKENGSVAENDLKNNLKFYQIAPGIVRIDSFLQEDSKYLSADYTNRESLNPHEILRNYIIFDDRRSDSLQNGFMYDRNQYLNGKLIEIEDGVNYRQINTHDLKLILEAYISKSSNVSYIKSLLEARSNYQQNELAQQYASCLVADFLFDDLILDPENKFMETSKVGCYLDSKKSAADCIGAGDIRFKNDHFSFHPKYQSTQTDNYNDFIGYPKSLLENREDKIVNYLIFPSLNLYGLDEFIDMNYSSLLKTDILPETFLTLEGIDYNEKIDLEALVQRKYEGESRLPLQKLRDYQIRFPSKKQLIITNIKNCEKYLKLYPYAQVQCIANRARFLVNNLFDQNKSLFEIKGYDLVKIVGLDLEIIIDPRMVKIHSDWKKELGEISEITAKERLSELFDLLYYQPTSGALGVFPKFIDHFDEYDESKFLLAQIFKKYKSHFFLDGQMICENNTYTFDVPSEDSKDFWYSFVDSYFSTVSSNCLPYKYLYTVYLNNYQIRSLDLFEITDNEYVEISDVKISGSPENYFFNLYGNTFQEIDGVFYQNIIYKEKDYLIDEIKNNFTQFINDQKIVLNLNNGKGAATLYQNTPFYQLDQIFLFPGFPLEFYFTDFQTKGDVVSFQLDFPVIPYHNEGIPTDYFGLSSGKIINSYLVKNHLVDQKGDSNNADFNLFYSIDEDKNYFLDPNNNSHHYQCYRNSKIKLCSSSNNCDRFESCKNNSSCKTGLICHPELKYCTSTCKNNLVIEGSLSNICPDVDNFPKNICVNNYCQPDGCQNTYTTILNSTFDSCQNGSLESESALINLNNINGFIYNNLFTPFQINCVKTKVLKIINEVFDDRKDPLNNFKNMRVEKNIFKKSIIETAGIGEASYVGSLFNNLFLNTKQIIANSNWRNYWSNNLFSISSNVLKKEEDNCCLFEDRSDYRYYHSAPFYGRHLFKNNNINIPNIDFLHYIPKQNYRPALEEELFGNEGRPTRRYNLNELREMNSIIEMGKALRYEPAIQRDIFDSIWDIDSFFGYYFSIADSSSNLSSKNFEVNRGGGALELNSFQNVRDFYLLNNCHFSQIKYLKKPYDISPYDISEDNEANSAFLINKSWQLDDFFNPGDYSKMYNLRKDFFGNLRRAHSLHGPFEDDGAIQICD